MFKPELNGQRVKLPNEAPVYLILDGQRRWIPDPPTYNNLFVDWNGIKESTEYASIHEGPALPTNTVLFKGSQAEVYLLDQHSKRWITNPTVFNNYHFGWDKIVTISQVLVDAISTHASIN